MKNKNKVYWVWLSLVCKPASRTAVELIRAFEDAKHVYDATAPELLASGILKEKDRVFSEILRHDLNDAKEIVEWCDKNGAKIVTPADGEYPVNLFSLRDAPLVLYVAGEIPDLCKYCSVAVVGSRDMSDYGRANAFRFAFGLAKGGAVVVSGLALGIDGMAMASCIASGGLTVGVLGSGIDVVYPKEHLELFKRVIKSGAVVTEYPPGCRPMKNNFPQRNRLISALSQGTLVIEASSDSGSLITARHAIYQGKDVFSLPGEVGRETSEGTNSLIKDGAFAVTDPSDILERYAYIYPHSLDIASSEAAACNIDFVSSASRVEMKYSVSSASDRRRVYSARKKKYYFDGDPIVRVGEVTADADWEDPFVLEIPEREGEKPPALSPDDVKPVDTRFSGKLTEPKRIDFELLSETDLKVYNSMSPDTPVIPEELISDGISIADVMASLTMLEISGAVEAGAGGYFMRSSSDLDGGSDI